MRTKILFLLLFLSLPVPRVFAQTGAPVPYDPQQKIPAAFLREDFELLTKALRELHPSLYLYTRQDTLDAVFDRTLASLTDPLTEQEFINHIYPAISLIRCGHTQLKHSKAYRNSPLRPKAVKLPFDVFVRGDRAWIIAKPDHKLDLKTGEELLGLNGVPTPELVRAGRSIWSADGYNTTWNEFFLNEYDFFEDLCWQYYGWRGPYTLSLRDPQDTVRTLVVPATPTKPALPPAAKDQLKTNPAKKPVKPKEEGAKSHLQLQFADSLSTAVLTVNGLEYGDSAFYVQAFRQIADKGSRNLVLDIRRNHGGDIRIITELLSYLADSSFVMLQGLVARTEDPSQNPYAAYFDAGRTESHRAGYGKGVAEGALFRLKLKPGLDYLEKAIPPAGKHRFKGPVYVLIGGGTFSSAGIFAAGLKAQCRRAVFIGQETGGGEKSCAGGTNQEFTMPRTGVGLIFPWMRMVSVSRTPVHGRGVMPDRPVQYPVEAAAAGQDLELQKALELIRIGK